ncbi:MAG: ABC transporter permease [Lawsonibacter sp.]|jgi:peptide/nickel transport system permease protein|nr:ABC transporter permease [Lawsonibacter sp.]
MWYSLKKSPTGMAGLICLTLFILMALFAAQIAPHDPLTQDLRNISKPPAWSEGGSDTHLLGTDNLGRDLLSRVIYGSRISIGVSLSGTILSCIVGTLLGTIAGYFGKWVDTLLGRIMDIQMSFPFMLLAIFIVAILGNGLFNIVIVAILTSWVRFARIARAEVLSIRSMDYIDAVRALGGKNFRIVTRHLIPNIASSVIVVATLEMSKIVLMEASLSFLGLGVPPQIPTWGRMLSDSQQYLQTAPHLAIFPGVAITLLVLSMNMFGDWTRDYLDPKIDTD